MIRMEEDVMFPILGIQNRIVMSIITTKAEVEAVLRLSGEGSEQALTAMAEVNAEMCKDPLGFDLVCGYCGVREGHAENCPTRNRLVPFNQR